MTPREEHAVKCQYCGRDLPQIEELIRLNRETLATVLRVERFVSRQFNRILGGVMSQVGDSMSLAAIQPGQTPVFQVAPTFSGAPFTTVAAQAAVTSSDATNFPVNLVSTDPIGLTFEAPIPATATPTGGSEGKGGDIPGVRHPAGPAAGPEAASSPDQNAATAC